MPYFQTRVYVYAVIVVHITDTHTSIPVVLTMQVFLFWGEGGEGVVRGKVRVHALKTYRGNRGMAVLVINLGTVARDW